MTLAEDTAVQNARATKSGGRIASRMTQLAQQGANVQDAHRQAVDEERARSDAERETAMASGIFDLSPAYDADRYAYTILAGEDRIPVVDIRVTSRGRVAFWSHIQPYGTIEQYPGVDDLLPRADAAAAIIGRMPR